MADRTFKSPASRFVAAVVIMLVIIGGLYAVVRSPDDIESVDPNQPPRFLRDAAVVHGNDTLAPFGLARCADTIWAVFEGDSRVAALDSELRVVKWVSLERAAPTRPMPTGWAVDSLHFYRADHVGRAVEVFDRAGHLIERWDRRPDGHPLLPFALDLFAGNLYVGDIESGRVLAISMRNDTPITERGELILTIPGFASDVRPFGFITGVTCTPDGRVLVAAADPPGIRAYTCEGRFAYAFDQKIPPPSGARQMAFDRVIFADLRDTTRFDPANTAAAGRLHVVDSRANIIFVYDPYGHLRFTYGQEEKLDFPNGIVSDPLRRRLVVADTHNRRLVEYQW